MTDSPTGAPFVVTRAPSAMVSSVDQLASAVGLRALAGAVAGY